MKQDEPAATLTYGGQATSERAAVTPERAADLQTSRLPDGARVHRYVILERVGEGGMGVVYAAYDPVLDRRVALKFLTAYDADRGGVRERRLLREAQAMARLSHPNAVVVYEVGTFKEHVFLAMEFVDGVDLRAWLDGAPRSFAEILEVFRAAGRGLAAAHAAGIVHRDFKPENVLVDRDGRARVTDFGLSRAAPDPEEKENADPRADEAFDSPSLLSRPLTRTNGLLGTPSYMSPEQHRGEAADERSDQYSLCIALYEAVYGARPFAGEGDERRERVLAGDIAAAPADSSVPRWCRDALVRGLSPAPADRFPSIEALFEALTPPATRRRRWVALAAGFAVALMGLGAYALATREAAVAVEPCPGAPAKVAALWTPAARERVRAAFLATKDPSAEDVFQRVERAFTGRAAAWQAAHVEACRATRVRGEQSEAMLDLRMQCLERARRQMAGLVSVWQESVDLGRAVQAAVTVGDLLGCADVVGLAAPIAPPRDPEVVRRVDELRSKLDEVEARKSAGQYQPALAMAREVVALVRPVGYAPLLAEALHASARLESEVGELKAGLSLLREAFTWASAAHDDVIAAKIMRDLLFTTGIRAQDFAGADALWSFGESAIARVPDRDDLSSDLNYVRGAVLSAQGHKAEAAEFLERALELGRRAHGAESVRIAQILNSMSLARWGLGQFAEAEKVSRHALFLVERHFGREHRITIVVVENLCAHLGVAGDADRASPYCDRALSDTRRTFPPEHPQVARNAHNVATVRLLQERNDEARVLLDQAERIMAEAVGVDDPTMGMPRAAQAELALKLGDVKRAHRLMAAVLPVTEKAYGKDHPDLAERLTIWGDILLAEGDLARSRAAHQRALAIRRKQRADHPLAGRSLQGLASVLLAERRYPEAIETFEQGRALVEKGYGGQHPSVLACMTGIGRAQLASGRTDAAIETLERAVALLEDKHIHLGEADTRFALARALWAGGQRDRAVAAATKARDAYARASIPRQAARVDAWLQAHKQRADHMAARAIAR